MFESTKKDAGEKLSTTQFQLEATKVPSKNFLHLFLWSPGHTRVESDIKRLLGVVMGWLRSASCHSNPHGGRPYTIGCSCRMFYVLKGQMA